MGFANSIIELNHGATASNVNGGGFDPSQTAGMLTDLTTDSNTANTSAPVVSSASYNFAAGDVGHWLYIAAGTNWTVGWYKIASVASNKATLSAAIDSANVRQLVNNRLIAPTVAGCATVGTPTNGTFTIDYSQGTSAILALTDFASVNGSAVVTTATGGVTPVMVGNFWRLASGTNATVGWYIITAYTSGTQFTVDRDCAGAADLSAGVGKVGGALSLGSSDDAVFEILTGSATATTRYCIKGNGSYSITGTVTMAADGDPAWPGVFEGYDSVRGDRPTGSARPIFACGATIMTLAGVDCNFYSLQFTGTAAPVVSGGSKARFYNCKFTNTSTTAGRAALNTSSTFGEARDCEMISIRGIGLHGSNTAGTGIYDGNYIHDCDVLISLANTSAMNVIKNNILLNGVTAAISLTGANPSGYTLIEGNTLYGAENKLGTGVLIASGNNKATLYNNTLTGFVTAVSHADVNTAGVDDYNNYYNNTNDVSSSTQWQKGANDRAVDPGFTSVTQRTGSTATTTSGNHLVQSGATFQSWGVVAGDFCHVKSGTGLSGTDLGIFTIASVDSETQITFDQAITAEATADKVWQITTGRNFGIGVNLKALGRPSTFPAGLTTSYVDIGASQRQESSAYAGTGGLQHIGSGFVRG